MPVLDHEVSDKVRISADKPYGCHSRTGMSQGCYAPDRVYRPDGTFYIIQTFIPNAMSNKCRSFYLWNSDPRCQGCTTDKDVEYAELMGGLK
jgi:hypothetical protein